MITRSKKSLNVSVAQIIRNVKKNTIDGEKELFYRNKKEALSILQTAGLQLPGNLLQDGFIYSIDANGSNVKHKFENVIILDILYYLCYAYLVRARIRLTEIICGSLIPRPLAFFMQNC